MDGPVFRQPDLVDHVHPEGAISGDPDAQSDLLDLGDVAELLGEPESIILAACRAFPAYVPVVGAGRERRFPSVALDVLRLITDATAAAVPAPSIVHLIETRYPTVQDLASEIRASPRGVPTGSQPDLPPFDTDEIVGRFQEAVEISILPIVQMLTTELGIMRATVDQMRVELRRTAQADALELVRVEVEKLAGARDSSPQSDAIAVELASIQSHLRPTSQGLDDIRLAVDGLREEMTALRWQLDQREQLGQLVAELAGLRAQVDRFESIGPLPGEAAREPDDTLASADLGRASGEDGGNPVDDVAPAIEAGGDPDRDPAPLQPSEFEPPSAIITEFASRTPRRMGRTLFADEG